MKVKLSQDQITVILYALWQTSASETGFLTKKAHRHASETYKQLREHLLTHRKNITTKLGFEP